MTALPFRAVLFDMDGTLVDTEPLWQSAEVALMARYGVVWTDEDQAKSLGGSTLRVANYMADLVARTGQDRPDPQHLAADFLATMLHELTTRPPSAQPGVTTLLTQVREVGLPTALVTSSSSELMEAVLAGIGRHWFDVTVNANDVERHKPDPLPYQQAARQLGVDPEWSVAIEDSPTGTAAATAAGCFVVAIEHMAAIDPAARREVVSSMEGVTVDWLSERFQPPR
jgi:HAD superfamily hydrolase (TIGR01509 family)